MMPFNENALYLTTFKKCGHWVLGIFHSCSVREYKDRLLVSFKNDGLKLVPLATTALSMGVNFPNAHYIVYFGCPRTLLDFHQKACQARWDEAAIRSGTVHFYLTHHS